VPFSYDFLFGLLTAMSFVCGLFFLRYWRSSGDRFFVFFTVAMWSLGATWALLTNHRSDEYTPYCYLLRLFAFVLILVAIFDKNRRSARSD
jgi:hypothetical protein